MANIYESDAYNILKVYIQGNSYVVELQRFPTSVYPEVTFCSLPFISFPWYDPALSADARRAPASGVSQSDWLATAISLIDTELSSYDSSFSGSASSLDTSSLTSYL